MGKWPNLAELLTARAGAAPVGLLGAPVAAGSVTAGSCDLAPALLRATLKRIGRYDVETGRELATQVADRGDVDVAGMTIDQATVPLSVAIRESTEAHALTLLVGGNNAITRPAVLSPRKSLRPCDVSPYPAKKISPSALRLGSGAPAPRFAHGATSVPMPRGTSVWPMRTVMRVSGPSTWRASGTRWK